MNAVDFLTAEIARQHGLRAQADWRPAVEAALLAVGALPESGGSSLGDAAKERALTEAIRRITVPETHFFRNSAQLAAAAAHLREIWATEQRRAHVWCAGSASGEEPYTIAILLHRHSGPGLAERCLISGSDINPDVVQRARRAAYTAWSFRGAPSWCLRYFERVGKGELVLSASEVRSAVEFMNESCQAGAQRQATASVDVVSFRNVAIYLEPEAIAELHRAFARILRIGGLLLLGPSDPRPVGDDFEFVAYEDHAPIFRRRTSEVRAPVARWIEHVAQGDPVIQTCSPSASVGRRAASTLPPPVPLCDASLGATLHHEPSTQLRLLGLSHLEKGDPAAAVAALRQALFLDPRDVLGRYFYALALKESGDEPFALRQLETVARELGQRADDDKLADGSTRASELRVSATFLRGQWV